MATTAPTNGAATVSTGTVGPVNIWDALTQAGASAVQAAGIMGNFIAESSMNPEANAMDSNGARSYGLAQWNAASYPNASQLVTGNPVADLAAQVAFFFKTVPQSALTGSTPQQVAANIAANYERCATCQAGGASNQARQANAGVVAGWASSGNWPASSSQGSTQSQLDPSQNTPNCAWGFNIPGLSSIPIIGGAFNVCIFEKTALRGLFGALLVGVALLPAVVALGMLGQSVPGVRTAEGAGLGGLLSSLAGPEGTVAGAAEGAEAGQKSAKRSRDRRQERHDEATARQVEARRRDSAKGPALRDDDRPRARQLASPKVSESQQRERVPF